MGYGHSLSMFFSVYTLGPLELDKHGHRGLLLMTPSGGRPIRVMEQ